MFASPFGLLAAGGLAALLAILALLFTPIVIYGHLSRTGSDDDIVIRVRGLFGLIRYKVRIPIVRFTGGSLHLKQETAGEWPGMRRDGQKDEDVDASKVMQAIDRLKTTMRLFYHFPLWIRRTLARVRLEEWNWSTRVGTGDAMWTAMATGLVWSVKSGITGYLSQLVRLQTEPKMAVQPVYRGACFTTEWSCKAKISLIYAVIAGIQLLARLKKIKGSLKQIQSLLPKAG